MYCELIICQWYDYLNGKKFLNQRQEMKIFKI